MTEAMQMTVSSEMANRIDDSSSTAARSRGEGEARGRPWVEAVMVGPGRRAARQKSGAFEARQKGGAS